MTKTKTEKITGYKMFNNDWTCRGFKYEIGKTYTHEGEISLCDKGFHFCKNLTDCFRFYNCVTWNKIAKVEALGEVKTDDEKCVTNKIKILEEIPFDKINEYIKTYINESDGVNESKGVNGSYGVNWSDGVNYSYGVDWSKGVNESKGVSKSDGVNESYGVNWSDGVSKSYGVNYSYGVDWSNGVNGSKGVYRSYGVNRSNSVNESSGVSWSNGVNESSGVSWSNGVNESSGVSWSYGVHGSNGVSKSDGVNESNGVNKSYGVNESYGVLNCGGVSNALFLANKPKTYTIFGKNVTEQRFKEVRSELYKKLGDWKPTFNNLRSLYIKSGSDWKLTPIPNAQEISKKEAWADMPKEAVEYIKSLEEFDKEMFKEITGIEV